MPYLIVKSSAALKSDGQGHDRLDSEKFKFGRYIRGKTEIESLLRTRQELPATATDHPERVMAGAHGILRWRQTHLSFMKLTASIEQEQESNRRRIQELTLMMRQSDEQESDVKAFIREIPMTAADYSKRIKEIFYGIIRNMVAVKEVKHNRLNLVRYFQLYKDFTIP